MHIDVIHLYKGLLSHVSVATVTVHGEQEKKAGCGVVG